jgi:hypothetical protein
MRAHFLALQALATTACLTDPAVSDNSFNLDECPSLIAALDVLNTGVTDVMIDCEPSCSATFAKVCCRLSSEVAACCYFICFTCTSCSFSAPLARPSNPSLRCCFSPCPLQLSTDCLNQLTDAFEQDTAPFGAIGSAFLAECASGGTSSAPAPAPADAPSTGMRRFGRRL